MEKKQNRMKGFVSDLIFYGILLSLIIAALAVSGSSKNGPRVIGGYSAFLVLTGSMEDVIPKGSLVITKSVDPSELKVGDDITYMVSENTTVTHRIIDIEEEYLNTGERAFYTQGTMNTEPDRNPAAAVNVVGKVVYHNKTLGTIVNFGQDNWPLVIFFIVVFLVFMKVIEKILRKEPEEAEATELAPEHEEIRKPEKRKTKTASEKPVEETGKSKKQKKTKHQKHQNQNISAQRENIRREEDEDGFVLEIIEL